MALFTESFDRPELDLTWQQVRGTDGLTLNGDGTATIATDENAFLRVEGDVGSPDMFAECVIAEDGTTTGAGDQRATVLLRALDDGSQNYYSCSLDLVQSTLTFLYWVNGVPTTPTGTGPFGNEINTPVDLPPAPFTLRMECEGDEFRGYLDGELVKTETDSQRLTGSSGGIGTQRGTTFGSFATGALGDDEPPDVTAEAPTYVGPVATVHQVAAAEKSVGLDVEAGDLVLVDARAFHQVADEDTWPDPPSGLAFATIAEHRVGSYTAAKLWAAEADTAGTVTITLALNPARNYNWGFTAHQWRDHGGIGAVAGPETGTGAPAVEITTTAASSAVYVGNSDYVSTTGDPEWRTDAGEFTQTYREYNAGNDTAVTEGYHSEVTAPGTYTVGMTAPAGQTYAVAAVEVLGPNAGEPPRDATGTGTVDQAATLDTAGTGSAVRGGTGVPGTTALDVSGVGEAVRVGEGVAGAALAATGSGAGDRTGVGTTALDAATTGTGRKVATGRGSAAVTLDQTAAGSKAADGAGNATTALSAASTAGTVERDGAGSAGLLAGALGHGGDVERTGTGSAAVELGARGAGDLTYYGSANVALGATGTGYRVATGRGTTGLTLDAGGSGQTDRAGAGETTLALDQAAAASAERTGTGSAGLTLDGRAAGLAARDGSGSTGLTLDELAAGTAARDGNGEAGLALDATGESRERTGTGEAALEVRVAGSSTGRVATGTGRAGLALDATGTGTRDTAGAGSAGLDVTAGGDGPGDRTGAGETALALGSYGDGYPSGAGMGRAGVELGTAGTGRRLAPGRGLARLDLGVRAEPGWSSRHGGGELLVGLGAAGTGPGDRLGTGSAGLALATAGGSGGRTTTGTGSAGVRLGAYQRGRRAGRLTTEARQSVLVATAHQARLEATG